MLGGIKLKIDMRTIKLFVAISLLFILLPFACKDDVVPPKGDTDPGILRTDEFGNILGGDSTDWCWRGASNGFSFGPAYPNPVLGFVFRVKFGLPVQEKVKIYFLRSVSDTITLKNDTLMPGYYQLQIDVANYNFTNTYQRLYIQCSSYANSDSCKNYGDIKFEE
jgi:hypothetical protein